MKKIVTSQHLMKKGVKWNMLKGERLHTGFTKTQEIVGLLTLDLEWFLLASNNLELLSINGTSWIGKILNGEKITISDAGERV